MPTASSTTSAPAPGFSRRRQWTRETAIGYLMQQAVENRECLSLAAGLVDPSTLPISETQRAIAHLFATEASARNVLQYGTTAGTDRLRRLLAERMPLLEQQPDLQVDPDRIVLTTGSQQLLSIIGEILIDPGDICFVAAPTYFVFIGVLQGLGAEIVPIPADEHGMRVDLLEQAIEERAARGELERIKLIYAVSYFENPSGVSLAADRRPALVDVARRWSRSQRIFVLEDAAYRELRYDGPHVPSAWTHDSDGDYVILAHTFSKTLSPGLRVGWGVLPRDLVTPVCDRKGNEDFGSANFNQHIVATILQDDLYDPHVREVCDAYRLKRDAMLAAAEEHFADIPGVSWFHPHGGLYVWMSLPEQIATSFSSPLFHDASHVEKVMYVPGDLCYSGAGDAATTSVPVHQMRLSFGVLPPEQITEGMHRLSRAVRKAVTGNSSDRP